MESSSATTRIIAIRCKAPCRTRNFPDGEFQSKEALFPSVSLRRLQLLTVRDPVAGTHNRVSACTNTRSSVVAAGAAASASTDGDCDETEAMDGRSLPGNGCNPSGHLGRCSVTAAAWSHLRYNAK